MSTTYYIDDDNYVSVSENEIAFNGQWGMKVKLIFHRTCLLAKVAENTQSLQEFMDRIIVPNTSNLTILNNA